MILLIITGTSGENLVIKKMNEAEGTKIEHKLKDKKKEVNVNSN